MRSITRGTTEALVVNSSPSGARVSLSNGMIGKTPTSFNVDRDEELIVTMSKSGYETVTVNVNCQVAEAGAAGMAGNVIVGGLIGAATDAGSMFECEIDESALQTIKAKAVKIIDPETDSVRIYRLCSRCVKKTQVSRQGIKVVSLDFLVV
jgi:hypothetical protein